MTDKDDIEAKVQLALTGDEKALEAMIRDIQDQVYGLARRFLVDPDAAQAATQEILILVVTKLSTFAGHSRFRTWVYRVSVNYLLRAQQQQAKEQQLDFASFREDLESGLTTADNEHAQHDPERSILLDELRVSCTMAMLLCLKPDARVAFVLGEILELEQGEAAEILEVSKASYRKRLSRARAEVVEFTRDNCGVVNESAKCSCPRRLPAALRLGRVDPANPCFSAAEAGNYEAQLVQVRRVESELRALKHHHTLPHFEAPQDFARRIADIVTAQ